MLFSFQCHARLARLENTAERLMQSWTQIVGDRKSEGKSSRVIVFQSEFLFIFQSAAKVCKNGSFMMIFGILIIINAIIGWKLCRCFGMFFFFFCSSGSSSALFWSHVRICCGCHLAALVLDDLQCRSCVSLSFPHTHTHTHTHTHSQTHTAVVPAAESHGEVHHARCSPEGFYHLPSTSFWFVSRWWSVTASEEKERKKEGKKRDFRKCMKGGVKEWNEATLAALSLWHVSLLADNQLSLNTPLWHILCVIFGHF